MKNPRQFAIALGAAGFILAVLCLHAFAQVHPNEKSVAKQDAKTADAKKKLQDAAQKGFALATKTNVSQSASIQAVLIPASLARRIFGKEVANNYAVVEVIISNDDERAALVVHSVFLDYSQWLLSGTSNTTPAPPAPGTSQVFNKASQVASIESRLVRGEMLDAQQWTARNWTIRSLTAVGSIAGGFAFPFSGDVAKGIAAFNGEVVPGAANLWPDGTVNQINRVTDFGFQTNKIIPKQASDILVAFFPVDRFLTSGFKKVFINDPAALFVPSEMLADPETTDTFVRFVKPWATQILAVTPKANSQTNDNPAPQDVAVQDGQFQAQVLLAMAERNCPSIDETDAKDRSTNANSGEDDNKGNDAAKPPDAGKSGSNTPSRANDSGQAAKHDNLCRLQTVLNGVSLNNIRIGLQGAMTVDVSTVPATIYGVDFDSTDKAAVWTTLNKEQTGTITGVYLSGGTPEVVDEQGKAIDGITIQKVTDGSSDTELHFTMKLTRCIASSSKIYFVVKKSPTQSEAENATNSAKKSSSTKTNTAKSKDDSVLSSPFQFSIPGNICTESSDEKGGAAASQGDKATGNAGESGKRAQAPSTAEPSNAEASASSTSPKDDKQKNDESLSKKN